MAPARPCCADCGVDLNTQFPRSFYFSRPLCQACYRAETQRPKADADRWVLERMFAQALPRSTAKGEPR